jgi:hypothetical protein
MQLCLNAPRLKIVCLWLKLMLPRPLGEGWGESGLRHEIQLAII